MSASCDDEGRWALEFACRGSVPARVRHLVYLITHALLILRPYSDASHSVFGVVEEEEDGRVVVKASGVEC